LQQKRLILIRALRAEIRARMGVEWTAARNQEDGATFS
jgi:hypothetical protein